MLNDEHRTYVSAVRWPQQGQAPAVIARRCYSLPVAPRHSLDVNARNYPRENT